MVERLLSIPQPFGGLSETLAFSSQEPGTAREFKNLRGLDAKTGRLRISQRSGLSKYLTAPLVSTSDKVADLLAFFEDNRQVSYTAITSGSETTTWSTETPSKKDTLNVKTDRQGNVYALDGNAGIVKYSADEATVWMLAVPVKDPNHVLRALWVDDVDHVYTAVSAGGRQDQGRIFCYEQLPDDKTELLFEIAVDAYVEDVRVFGNRLYTIQNRTDRARAYVRIYREIDGVDPKLDQEWIVPYPVNSLAIKADGSVLVACEPSGDTDDLYWRLPDPLYPNFSVASEDWTPYQLTDYAKRVWAWYVAEDIDFSDVTSDYADGVEILRWRDRTRNGRHLYADLGVLDVGPKLALDGLSGRKGVRFSNGAASPYQSMRSGPNSSYAKEFADQQRTMVPAYTDSSFAIYIVCRPSQQAEDGTDAIRALWGQDRDNAQSGSDDHILLMNATDTNTINLPASPLSGSIYWFTGETVTSGDGTGDTSIRPGAFDVKPGTATVNPGNFAIICLVNDGNVTGDTQDSLFQVNGNPIALFASLASFTLEPSYLGIFRTQDRLPAGTSYGFLGDVLEVLVLDRKSRSDAAQNVLTYDSLEHDSVGQSQTINDNTVIVGYLAHKYGAQGNLPFGTAATNNYPHPFGITGTSPDQLAGPPDQSGLAVSSAQALANKRFGAVVKYSSEGKIQWCANEMASGDGSRPGGFGYAVAVNSEGNVYSIGPNPTGGSGGTQQIRMIVDSGTSFSIASGDGAWSTSLPSSAEFDYKYPKVDVDEFDNFYLPFYETGLGAGSNASFRVYSKTGTLLHSKLLTSPQLGTAVAVDRRIPDYRNDLATKRVEHVIVAGIQADPGNPSLAKIRLASAAQSGATPRTLQTVGVSSGDIVKFTTAGVTAITGGSGALDDGAYIHSTTLFKKGYWTDGRRIQVYDPIAATISELVSTSSGSKPDRVAFLEAWRGRLVGARSADEPHNWFMSKKDDPTNWDYFPPVPTETDAIAGNNSQCGLCPDIINTVIPYSEDRLIFGCDHSIWMLVGDPAAGGRFELVSETIGMSFGRPWCKDPIGVLYFFGSQGGLYRWVPGAIPERLSEKKIERTLQEVDLGTHYIRLAYNRKDEGVHILQFPFGDGGTSVEHWFFETKTESFATDVFGSSSITNVQPTAVMVIDGDEFDDRAVLFGCEDGQVRKWDRDALSDDTQTDLTTKVAIDSVVTIGPLAGKEGAAYQSEFSGLVVVLSEQDDGARYELFSSETADSIGTVRRKGELRSGRNPPRWEKVTGAYCWLRLRNSAPEERWALEDAYLRVAPAGLARSRSS